MKDRLFYHWEQWLYAHQVVRNCRRAFTEAAAVKSVSWRTSSSFSGSQDICTACSGQISNEILVCPPLLHPSDENSPRLLNCHCWLQEKDCNAWLIWTASQLECLVLLKLLGCSFNYFTTCDPFTAHVCLVATIIISLRISHSLCRWTSFSALIT